MNIATKLKLKIISSSVIIFLVFLIFTTIDKNNRVDMILENDIQKLDTQYRLTLSYFHNDIASIKIFINNNTKAMELLSKVDNSTLEEKSVLRKELYKLLTPLYKRVSTRGILQFHFVSKENISFLRMHKPDKFGDDLTDVRYSFMYVNKKLKAIKGFERGKTTHAFRYAYPIIYKDKHLGAVEISLTSDFIQYNLSKLSKIHTHFLVKKNIIDMESWDSKYLKSKYIQSMEHDDFMYTITEGYNKKVEEENSYKVKPFKGIIAKNMALKKQFSIYRIENNVAKVISFLPIQNIKDKKIVAYLVSHTNNHHIYDIYIHYIYVMIVFFIFFTLLAIFLYMNLKRKEELQIAHIELKELANRDSMTNLFNRRYFYDIAKELISLIKRDKKDMALLMIDIDKFKDINDTYGHNTGDTFIKLLASLMMEHTRNSDVVARIGGEEFVILLPDTSKDGAFKIANKIRIITEQQTVTEKNKKIKFTISIGVGEFDILHEDKIEDVLKRADEALYKAKNSGRNKVC